MKKLIPDGKTVKVFGLPEFEKTGKLERVPENVRRAIPSLEFLGRRPPGGRICFRTNSPVVNVKMEYETLKFDIGMSVFACQSANLFFGPRCNAPLAGLVTPHGYEDKCFSREFRKQPVMEDVTLFLPRNEILKEVSFEVEDGALVEQPTPYTYETPIVYYGSSITEGGCLSRLTNAYPYLISRHLDTDFINFGFSGSAKGELPMADYISSLRKSMLVYDYDHNAPDADHLRRTHEPFFQRIREKEPDLPVLMLTRPDFDYDPSAPERRDIIYATYEHAVAEGDKNVYFIDGETFFGTEDRDACIVDRTHPTDLGFYRMTQVIEPVIRNILKIN